MRKCTRDEGGSFGFGGELKFFNAHAELIDKRTFKRFIAPLRRIKWVVYCKQPFAGPEQVLRYLSRYTHRVAISNRRLVAADSEAIPNKGPMLPRTRCVCCPGHARAVARA